MPEAPMSDALAQIDQLARQAADELANDRDTSQLEQFRIKYLGSTGSIKDLMKLLRSVPGDQKPVVGQRVNAVKDQVSGAYEARKTELTSAAGSAERDAIDVTEPGLRPRLGNRHVLMK